MAEGDSVLIGKDDAVATPNRQTVPSSLRFEPTSVSAVFHGSGAAGDFQPCLSLYSQSGLLLARTFPPETVTAGDDAEVTYTVPLGGGSASTATRTVDGAFLFSDGGIAVPDSTLTDLDTFGGTATSGTGAFITVQTGPPQRVEIVSAVAFLASIQVQWQVPAAGTIYLQWSISNGILSPSLGGNGPRMVQGTVTEWVEWTVLAAASPTGSPCTLIPQVFQVTGGAMTTADCAVFVREVPGLTFA